MHKTLSPRIAAAIEQHYSDLVSGTRFEPISAWGGGLELSCARRARYHAYVFRTYGLSVMQIRAALAKWNAASA